MQSRGIYRLLVTGAVVLFAAVSAFAQFGSSIELPVPNGSTARAYAINNGTYDSTNNNVKCIAVGNVDGKACYWNVTADNTGATSAVGPNQLPNDQGSSQATGVNDYGDICGYGYSSILNTTAAIVWHKMENSSSYTRYEVKAPTSGTTLQAFGISNSFVCGCTYSGGSLSTPGWYVSLANVYSGTAATQSPLGTCFCIDLIHNHIGGGNQVLIYNPTTGYATTATSAPWVNWPTNPPNSSYQMTINAIRENGGVVYVAGPIAVSNSRQLACFGTVSSASVLNGNIMFSRSKNIATGLNDVLTSVGYYPYNTSLDYYGAWYSANGGTMNFFDSEKFSGCNDTNSHRVVLACGVDMYNLPAVFW